MNESEQDQQLDAAWRSASRDEPPVALDLAIRTAARRAVKAAPAPSQGRDKHWRYPLAAAATVALLALGIAQLTPPERVAPLNLADMDAAPGAAAKHPAAQAAVDAPVAAQPAGVAKASPAASQSPPATPAPTGVPRPRAGPDRLADAKLPAQAAREAAVPQPPTVDASDQIGANSAASPPAAARTPAAGSHREPFPLTATAGTDRRPADLDLPPPPANARTAAAEAAPVRARTATAQIARSDDAKAPDVSARSVADWIKQIRDLTRAGRLDEAAKELDAFRLAYGDRADSLLPADLRQSKP